MMPWCLVGIGGRERSMESTIVVRIEAFSADDMRGTTVGIHAPVPY